MLPYYHNYIVYSFYFPLFKTQILTTKSNSFFSTNYHLYSSQYNWLFLINRLDLTFNNTQAIDLSAYIINNSNTVFLTKLNLLSLTYTNFFIKPKSLKSQEPNFKNFFFLERELREMFGINLTHIKDTRNLLLDYTLNSNPLSKNFPVEGYKEVFLNLFEDKIEYNTSNYIEL